MINIVSLSKRMKSVLKTGCICICVFVLICAVLCDAAAKTIYDYGDWKFVRRDGVREYELYSCTLSSAEITVPSSVDGYKVTAVGAHAFLDAENVEKVVLSNAVTDILDYAFSDCESLVSVSFPASLTYLGSHTFNAASGLTEADLSDTRLSSIEPYTFLNAGVRSVRLPQSCVSIGAYAFAQCASLSEVYVPASVQEISETAFSNSDSTVIYCYSGSAAHLYAEAHEIAYVLLDAPVLKTDIRGAEVKLEADTLRYNGTEQRPRVTVTLGGVVLDSETDFVVEYKDNLNVGESTVTVIGVGDYEGKAYARFAIRNVLGDADGNGEVEILDATLIQRRIVYLSVPDPERVELVGDVSADGLDITDATDIQRWLIQMEVPYPINELMSE